MMLEVIIIRVIGPTVSVAVILAIAILILYKTSFPWKRK